MNRHRLIIVCALCSSLAASLGYAVARFVHANDVTDAIQQVVTVSWGDGKYGKAFYGAEVYLEPAAAGYAVRGRIWIGRGNSYWHDLGVLGNVATSEEAVAKWGRVQWDETAVTIGPGDPMPFVMPRTRLESHR